METGKTYKLTYGNGSQFFYVVSVNGRKAGGLRLVGHGTDRTHWDPSSIKVDDPRVQGEVPYPFDAPALPEIPAKVGKAEMKVLQDAFDAAKKVFEAEYDKRVFVPYAGCTNSGFYYVPPEVRNAFDAAGSVLKNAKRWNVVHV